LGLGCQQPLLAALYYIIITMQSRVHGNLYTC